MGSYNHGMDSILDTINDQTGLTFEIFNSGGHTMILEARLETGDWMWISDYDADVTPLAQRRQLEAEGIRVGWLIAIYPTDPDDPTSAPHPTRILASFAHETATAEELPQLVIHTLQSLPRHAHHRIQRDRATVTYGIESYGD
ncbi:hypothetical protein [[Mycobacterium] nativiensis]|uniref:Uncharacterized protein n=1 Tax=[Mycobacterium] nativiensis TaxID=2855503 RepID=A0ABU5XWB4_9MYCO|nr:hypothetical protein [Mycolicibacter sp. MYC340]MEB3031761.1 hypothetical protein [Mycolicibacter sp. MYC340]